MKKIMFNDKYGLTKAVLNGSKTQTRRMLKFRNGHEIESLQSLPYKVGDVVAIAQPYKDICLNDPIFFEGMRKEAGWSNKLFVQAKLMPWQICIDYLWFERLQDISYEGCLREGIFYYNQPPLHHENDRYAPWPPYVKPYKYNYDNLKYFCNPSAAFAYLIDQVCGRGTWNINPPVVVYQFHLQRAGTFQVNKTIKG